MAPRRRSVPSYCHHKATNQAFVKVPDGLGGRKFVYLGLYDSPESHAEYRRILAELHTPGPSPLPAAPTLTLLSVNEVLLAFLRWAGTHYRTPEGEPTTEVKEIKRSSMLLSTSGARSFEPELKAPQDEHSSNSAGESRARLFSATPHETLEILVFSAIGPWI